VALKALGRQRVTARVWRRVCILQLLDRGWTMADAAEVPPLVMVPDGLPMSWATNADDRVRASASW